MGSERLVALHLLLVGVLRLGAPAEGGCVETRKCCRGRDVGCSAAGWRLDRVFGTCFCDEACKMTGDCCYDYAQACPVTPCIVSEWSHWSGCAEQCRPTVRIRRRNILQEPLNGGDPCPLLEEKAGCLEYLSYQGQYCGHSHVPAFITSSEYSKGRKRRSLSAALSSVAEEPEYCMEYKIESLTHHCNTENRPFARWMQYLREGYTVCVLCQSPAMNPENHHCYGDGAHSDGNGLLHWQAVGNIRCRGTWKKVRRVEQCSCPPVHSFVFT
ncbi:somatomedin-B and thrombospondin type-1 domain-containing protein [Latimeria chalumnae]|uniref:Somatomedin B and thrombospondin type 1 domain containing n=1 Tax=Latimeria chalumnae TaxID=7897 RepID=H3A997_LATCH|nr:PREDICTED: somatomedin-B and thrombospondin type-1 domain-containing protein [Latimeria chalumnae]|eukprot:XP_005992909.1 PREDICTED: somatomedin-B and thrombospondin type-1 domain-containing protein [Latimeria chalumnae]